MSTLRLAALCLSASTALLACDDGPTATPNDVPTADAAVVDTTSDATVETSPDTTGDDAVTTDGAGNEEVGPTTDTSAETTPSTIPTEGVAIRAWLEAGNYSDWDAESAPHDGAGPHFGTVRTFINAPLASSLAASAASHPVGAASVKELYGSGGTVLGYAAMVKVDADSAGGAGWYWYEVYNGSVFADSNGSASCTGCHSSGADFFRSPYPLQ